MIAVVLAAGAGTRLRPITLERSKAMVPVVGRPLIACVLDTIKAGGIDDFVIVVGPEDREVEGFLGDYVEATDRLRYVVQRQRQGMAHALGCAAQLLSGDFVLSSCDSLIAPENVAALIGSHRETGADVTLSVMDVESEAVSRSAAIELRDGWVRRIIEKPAPKKAPSNTIAIPLYVCSEDVLELLPEVGPSRRGEYELADVFQLLIDRGGRVARQVVDWRRQVSTPGDLLALNMHFLAAESTRVEGRPGFLGPASILEPPLVIGRGVRIGAGCEIGPNVYLEGPCAIEDDVRLRDSVVLRNVSIERGSRITGEILWAEASA